MTDNIEKIKQGASVFLGRAKDKTKQVLDRSKNEAVRVSQIGKLQLDRSFLERDRKHLLQRLGEAVYQDHASGKLELDNRLKSIVSGIDQIDAQISDDTQTIDKLKHKKAAEKAAPKASATKKKGTAKKKITKKTTKENAA